MKQTTCKHCHSAERSLVLDVSDRADTYLDYLQVEYRGQTRQYFRCSKCGLIYRNPILDEKEKDLLYDKFRDVELRKETKEQYFTRITSLPQSESENAEKLEFLQKYINPREGAVMDVGCGAGVFLYAFKLKYPQWQASGVEPTKDFSAIARNHGIHIVSDYLKPDTFNTKFDLITFIHVVEHLENPSELLRLAGGFLKPNGLLYVECPSDKDIGYLDKSHDRFMCQHDVIFSQQTLAGVIEKGGFKVTYNDVFLSKRKRNNVRVLARLS